VYLEFCCVVATLMFCSAACDAVWCVICVGDFLYCTTLWYFCCSTSFLATQLIWKISLRGAFVSTILKDENDKETKTRLIRVARLRDWNWTRNTLKMTSLPYHNTPLALFHSPFYSIWMLVCLDVLYFMNV
jgi:hypothetical protein